MSNIDFATSQDNSVETDYRDAIERLEAEQADYLAGLEEDGTVVAGPAEWFKQSAWDAPTHKLRRSLARFVELRNKAKDEPAGAPSMAMMAGAAKGPFASGAALLFDLGYGPIPENAKKGIPGWSKYYLDEARLPDDIRKLIAKYPHHELGIAGGYNNVLPLDIDTDDADIQDAILAAMPESTVGKRGSKGFTLFYRFEGDPEEVCNRTYYLKDEGGEKGGAFLEVLWTGRKTTIPPTMHAKTGMPYEWLDPAHTLFNTPVGALPAVTAADLDALEAAIQEWTYQRPIWTANGIDFKPLAGPPDDLERRRQSGAARAALDRLAGELFGMGKDSGRNRKLFDAVCTVGKWVHHGVLDRGEMIDALVASCNHNGLDKDKDSGGKRGVLETIKSGLWTSRNDVLCELEDRPRTKVNGEFRNTKPKGLANRERAHSEEALGEAKAGWGDPEPLISKIKPEPYPVEALPGGIFAAVKEVHKFVKSPLSLIASSSLVAVSTALQAHIDVRRDEELISPVGVFMMTIGDSGERKTQTDKMFTRAAQNYQDRQESDAIPLLGKYQSAIDAWQAKRAGIKRKITQAAAKGESTEVHGAELREHDQGRPKLPRVPKILREDATPEALAKKLQHDWPSAAIIANEAAVVFGSHGMNINSVMRNLGLLNKLWDGGRYQSDRADDVRSRDVRGARFTMGLMVQESVLREFFMQSKGLARGSGFIARFLVAWPESTMGTRLYEPPAEGMPQLAAFTRRLKQILEKHPPMDEYGRLTPFALTFSPEAKAAWIEYHDSIEVMLGQGSDFYDVRDVASKSADNAARIAALFTIFQHDHAVVIECDDFLRASRIARWYLTEARRFLGEFALPEELADAARLEEWLVAQCRKNGGNIVLRREIQRCGPYGLRDSAPLAAALKELCTLDRIRLVQNGKKFEVHINPALLV